MAASAQGDRAGRAPRGISAKLPGELAGFVAADVRDLASQNVPRLNVQRTRRGDKVMTNYLTAADADFQNAFRDGLRTDLWLVICVFARLLAITEDAVVAAIAEAVIDANPQSGEPMGRAAYEQALEKLDAQIDELEWAEECTVVQLEAEGRIVMRREDANWLAVLGIQRAVVVRKAAVAA
jgi:hypothetical protein